MTTCGQLSKILETDDETTFEWTLSANYLIHNESPPFYLSDTCWNLSIIPSFEIGCDVFSLFQLKRLDKGKIIYITFILKVMFPTYPDKEVCRCSRYFDQFDDIHRCYHFEKSILSKQSSSDIIVTCCMKFHPEKTIAIETNERKWSSLNMEGVSLLSHRMKDMLIKGSDFDLKIIIKNKEFGAHTNILRARSPVFATMLTHDTTVKDTGTITIEDCDPDSFDDFLLYVYSGKVENLTHGKALQLYHTANKYDFPILKKQCVSLLESSLSVTSICDVILLAVKHEENDLLEVAMEYFAQNMMEILETAGWQSFMTQNPVEANKLYIQSMKILHPKKKKKVDFHTRKN